uniref:Pro-melanin-concentrating hormone n=1 Tax=Sinocyclocheilus anshuiensis TaxID=1608454 RepID=A0A671M3S4_9TELE
MASSYMVIFALAILVELTTRTTTALAVPIEGEDDASEIGPGRLTYRRQPIIEGRLVDENGTKHIFILADTGIKGSLGRETNLAFSRTFPVFPPRGMDRALDGFNTSDERRSTDNVIPIGRRDIDILRCMIGRVYRPCWQA